MNSKGTTFGLFKRQAHRSEREYVFFNTRAARDGKMVLTKNLDVYVSDEVIQMK